MNKIKISRQEASCIIENVRIPKACRKMLEREILKKDNILLKENEAYLLRELCGLQLQIDGFDQNDQPTPKGLILESLIDKLYTD